MFWYVALLALLAEQHTRALLFVPFCFLVHVASGIIQSGAGRLAQCHHFLTSVLAVWEHRQALPREEVIWSVLKEV